MNRQYMDFMPQKAKNDVRVGPKKELIPNVRPVSKIEAPRIETPKVEAPRVEVPRVLTQQKVEPKPKFKESAPASEPELGVIENIGVRELKAPGSQLTEEQKNLMAAKAKRIGVREEKDVDQKPSGLSTKPSKEAFKVPSTPFINQDKVEKRPLSKNVYQKKVEVPKEEPKGPVTIITKPEKQAHVSLIVTIILTIILGAAAGTVAFLLLPK